MPNITAKATPMPRLPRPNRRMRNRPGSSIGCSCRFSNRTQATPRIAAATKAAMMPPWDHPYSGPWMRPKTSDPRAAADRTLPTGSSGWPRVSRDVGTTVTTRTNSRTAMGTFTKKIEPHQKYSRSSPADRIPSAPPAPAKPAQMAMARLRSWAGKTVVRMDRVAGMTSPAPMPMMQRQSTIWPAEPDDAPARAPTRMIPRPMSRAPLRPKRSPRAPAGRRMAASTRA